MAYTKTRDRLAVPCITVGLGTLAGAKGTLLLLLFPLLFIALRRRHVRR